MDKIMDLLLKQDGIFTLLNGIEGYSIERIFFNIIVATLLGLFIYFIYKKTYTGVMYSQNFNITIVMISLITTIIIMLIGNNLALSLGMVGSLSIIRFRTVIKEPRDMGFLFWAIAVGLASGTGEFILAMIGSVMLAILLLIFKRVIYRDYGYLLVIKGAEFETKEISTILKDFKIPFKLRLRATSSNLVEISYEITLKSMKEDELIKSLKTIEGLDEIHIVSYDGEISG